MTSFNRDLLTKYGNNMKITLFANNPLVISDMESKTVLSWSKCAETKYNLKIKYKCIKLFSHIYDVIFTFSLFLVI